MLRSTGWLIGLPLLCALWVGATLWREPSLRDALAREADGIVQATGAGEAEPWLRVEIVGRDLVARGEAPGEEARAKVLGDLAALPGLRQRVDRIDLLAKQAPFVWSARLRDRNRIDILGYRPAELGRSAFHARLAEALPPGVVLRDGARAARGAPEGFAEAAAAALRSLVRLSPGAVATLTGTSVSLQGEAPTVEAYGEAVTMRSTLPPAFTGGAVEVLAPEVQPFAWAAQKQADDAVTLTGYVPSEAARAAILAGARAALGDVPVRDRMQPGRGLAATIELRDVAGFAFAALPLLTSGSVSLTGSKLAIRGETVDAQAVADLNAQAAASLPPGAQNGGLSLVARPVSPYRVAVRRTPEAVTLSGHLPSTRVRDEVLRAVRPRFFGERIVDRTRIADGAPPELAAGLTAGIAQLSLLATGEVAIADRTLRVSGKSLYEQGAERLRADAPRLAPAGWTASAEIEGPRGAAPKPEPLDAAGCRERLAAVLTGRPIRFAPGSMELRAEFYPVLDDVAALAKRCGARIEVAGHDDPPGSVVPTAPAPAAQPQAAKAAVKPAAKPPAVKPATTVATAASAFADPELPRRRAQAIIDYLLTAGVAGDRVALAPDTEPAADRRQVAFAVRS